MTILLDTHSLIWVSSDRGRLSQAARGAVEAADELAVASVTWYEIAWLIEHERITGTLPLRSWLDELSSDIRTVPITPAIAERAVKLPRTFPSDPIDRIIYATAVENGWQLVTKDLPLRRHKHAWPVTVW